jgi:predicted DNA binding CopG/RHH family protein
VSDKVKVNIYMSSDMLAALKKLAKLQDVPYAELVRAAVRDYVTAHAGRIAKERQALNEVNKP